MRRRERLFKRSVKQMKIYRDNKPSEYYSHRKLWRCNDKPCDTRDTKEYPVCQGNKFQDALLYFHLNISLLRRSFALSYRKPDISESCCNTKPKKNKCEPGIKFKPSVKIHANRKSDKYRKRYLEAKTAIICQLTYITSRFSFHIQERFLLLQ